MLAHIPVLSVVNVRIHGSDSAAVHTEAPRDAAANHHAPEPFKVASALTNGLLEIVDTPQGERMRLSLERHTPGMEATVTIDRAGGKVESLRLIPVPGNDGVFLSTAPPDEPHEFSAQLRLKLADRDDVVAFKMAEPAGHPHSQKV